ncbi:hypothetical protein [Hymenobacter arizonensis]|nr:hypothetical protein [Hymenobacter arizonensis]
MTTPAFKLTFYTWVLPPVLAVSFRYFWSIFDFVNVHLGRFPSPTFWLCFGLWNAAGLFGCVKGAAAARRNRNWPLRLVYVLLFVVCIGFLITLWGVMGAGAPKT